MIEGYPYEDPKNMPKAEQIALKYKKRIQQRAAEERKTGYDPTMTPSSIANEWTRGYDRKVTPSRIAEIGMPKKKTPVVQEPPKDEGFGVKVLRTLNAGSGQFFSSAAQAADWVAGGIEEIERYLNGGFVDGKFEKGDAPLTSSLFGGLHQATDYVTKEANAQVEQSRRNWSDSKVGSAVNEVVMEGVASIPQIMLALSTGGASAIPQLASQMGVTEAALWKLISDPKFWLSVGRSTGSSYEKAKAAGADREDALTASFLRGLTDGVIDAGGAGNDAWKSDRSLSTGKIAGNLGKEALQEGGVSYLQDKTGHLAERTYQKSGPLFSTTDENALFNPGRDAKQFAIDTAASFFGKAAVIPSNGPKKILAKHSGRSRR